MNVSVNVSVCVPGYVLFPTPLLSIVNVQHISPRGNISNLAGFMSGGAALDKLIADLEEQQILATVEAMVDSYVAKMNAKVEGRKIQC